MANTPNRQDPSKDYIWGKRTNKKWMIIGISVAVVAVIVGGVFLFNPTDNGGLSTKSHNSNSSDSLVRRAIDGVYVPADQSNHYPVAVMIENLVSSRPPSGLSNANVVYEALAEGGITRFMALYTGELYGLPEIGPVRSARPYYLDWALEYKALYAHVGGSPQAIADIKSKGVFDLNQFFNSQYYWRDSNRLAPHNLYTSGEKLAFALRDLEASASGDFQSWKFKDDASLPDRPTVSKKISIQFSSMNYNVEYQYDREQNDYLRYQATEIHRDKPTAEGAEGSAIRAKNVIVQKVKTRLLDDERLGMDTVDEGVALIFRDGTAIEGQWKKASVSDRTRYYDADGDEIELNAGTTWVEIVPTDRDVEYDA
ncbi:MAG: DUF3048 domain-containing protein [Patescibacteria group bacterium]|nr:DUF3048 domain-containing protein [Patescibacteria group bacterium]MDD5716070.1 DUF3048 domain-containing protein [Patescibacteria group bacterium]